MGQNPRHIKLLTDEQLQSLKDRYDVEYSKGNIIVKLKNRNHTVIHDAKKAFSLRCDDRRVTINPKAIAMWQKHFKKMSLFDVQQAINKVTLERNNPTDALVEKELR